MLRTSLSHITFHDAQTRTPIKNAATNTR